MIGADHSTYRCQLPELLHLSRVGETSVWVDYQGTFAMVVVVEVIPVSDDCTDAEQQRDNASTHQKKTAACGLSTVLHDTAKEGVLSFRYVLNPSLPVTTDIRTGTLAKTTTPPQEAHQHKKRKQNLCLLTALLRPDREYLIRLLPCLEDDDGTVCKVHGLELLLHTLPSVELHRLRSVTECACAFSWVRPPRRATSMRMFALMRESSSTLKEPSMDCPANLQKSESSPVTTLCDAASASSSHTASTTNRHSSHRSAKDMSSTAAGLSLPRQCRIAGEDDALDEV